MSFANDVDGWVARVQRNMQAVHLNSVSAAQASITDGSPVTGAPGQPVDTGNLRASFTTQHESEWVSMIVTNVEYAPAIEEGRQQPYRTAKGTQVTPQPIQFRSAVGGAHSVALTQAGWGRLVEQVVTETVR